MEMNSWQLTDEFEAAVKRNPCESTDHLCILLTKLCGVGGCCLLKGMLSTPESAYPSCYTKRAQTKNLPLRWDALYNLDFYRPVLCNHWQTLLACLKNLQYATLSSYFFHSFSFCFWVEMSKLMQGKKPTCWGKWLKWYTVGALTNKCRGKGNNDAVEVAIKMLQPKGQKKGLWKKK